MARTSIIALATFETSQPASKGWLTSSILKRIIPASLAILIALAAVACGASSPAATPTPENTPLPAATPTQEFEQRPALPAPSMQGAVDVGAGRKLNYQCYGAGTPAVIVEPGGGDEPILSLSWNAVILGVYPTTCMCIYDPVEVPTSQDVAENLHLLLGTARVPGPYILVAHSVAGYHARVFAHLYPDDVAGMLLVDASPTYPDGMYAFATAYPTYSPNEDPGITKGRLTDAQISTIMPSSIYGFDMLASAAQVREAGSLGDIPLIVISHTPSLYDWPDLDPAAREQYAAITLKIQADLATLSSKGVFLQASTSQHFISLYEPQIIIDAITKMLQEIRKQ